MGNRNEPILTLVRRQLAMLQALAATCLVSIAAFCANEAALLENAAKALDAVNTPADNLHQKLAIDNARKDLEAAQNSLTQGDKSNALKNKRRALKWVVQAVRECMDPGKAPGEIAGALKEEGALDDSAIGRFHDLLAALVAAKARKAKAEQPWYDGMAIDQIVQGLWDLVDGGLDGFHPEKALVWYLNAAGACENTEEAIRRLLDYLAKHKDATGLTDISPADYDKAKAMVDELFRKKAAGAPDEEIDDLVERIKKFLEEAGRRTAQARHKVLDGLDEKPPEKPAEKPPAAPPLAVLPVTTVVFTAIDGKTNVNRDLIGDIDRVTFLAADGKEAPAREAEPDLDPHAGTYTLGIGKAAGLGGVILTGTAGVVRLIQSSEGGEGPGRPGAAIVPADGIIDIRNGTLRETLTVPPELVDASRAPQEHSVQIGGQAATVAATRPGRLAVTARGLPATAGGTVPVTVTSPSGASLTATCPAWGYEISVPEVTRTGTPVPVMVRIYGLEPDQRVSFVFLPEPGQRIEPKQVSIPAAQAMVPSPIAQLRAERPGPQALNVAVQRE